MKVTFLPMDQTVEVRRGQTLLSLAKEKAITIYYQCDGNCTCGTCFVEIEKGAGNLTPITEPEKAHLERQNLEKNMRLSCQARILGDVTVRICGKTL